jgi:hypothetical protein
MPNRNPFNNEQMPNGTECTATEGSIAAGNEKKQIPKAPKQTTNS